MGTPDCREVLAVLEGNVLIRVFDNANRPHVYRVDLPKDELLSFDRALISRPFGFREHRVWLRAIGTNGRDHTCLLRVSSEGKRLEEQFLVSATTHEKFHYLFNAFAIDWELIPEMPLGVLEIDPNHLNPA